MSEKKLILVLNCGSSSIKFSVIDPVAEQIFASGVIEEIASKRTKLKFKLGSANNYQTEDLPELEYSAALNKIIWLLSNQPDLLDKVVAVGHRVVHGGEKFTSSVIINQEVLQSIADCISLAPLHNPAHLLGIKTILEALPKIKQVAVFDTAFHQTLPEHSYLYALPYQLYRQHKIRRYGAHGTSHRFVANQASLLLEKPLTECSLITAHLGNGCSVAAILNGKSVDTSMGLTPLEGLIMGTRSGDIDPDICTYLANNLKYDTTEISNLLNKQSGLLGISEATSDMRTIEELSSQGNKSATLALEMFCYRLAKYIAAYLVPLGKLDALVFTGGIGENSPLVRAKTITSLKFLGLVLDPEHNETKGKYNHQVITKSLSPMAMVIPTNEELMIAKDTLELTLNQ